MKRIISILCAATILLSTSITSFARWIEDKNNGITFNISDNWEQVGDDLSFVYNEYSERVEDLEIFSIDNILAYSSKGIDAFTKADLTQLCEETYSNQNLADELSASNNDIYINITTDSVITKYEYYNNVKYFRYEKAYTAHAYGYIDTPFYDTVFLTARNGKIYFIEYGRSTDDNNFRDVSALLDSISFETGEIKIKIDNKRIYPDSVPMIVEERTLVPIRAVAEEMGYRVSWDGINQIVTMTDGYTTLEFQINNYTAYKNGYKEIPLDVPPVIFDDRTYLPLRAVAEAMNADVNWDGNTRTVDIWQ